MGSIVDVFMDRAITKLIVYGINVQDMKFNTTWSKTRHSVINMRKCLGNSTSG